jgi:prepilin-type N-terminal cleavage/methylation domain-containing protein
MTRRDTQRAAFTLLEMLFALGMMSVLAGSLYATLRTAFHARDKALGAVEPARRAELAIELMRPAIESALPPTGILAGAFTGTDATNDDGEDADSVVLHALVAHGEPLGTAPGIVKVELGLDELDDGSGRALVRWTTANLLAPETPDPQEEVICRDVAALNLTYFDGTSWVDSWDSGTMDNALPVAVEVELTLAADERDGEDAEGYSISRVLLLPCSVAGAAEQTGEGQQGTTG